MNIHQPIDMSRHSGRIWWVMLAGCAARFTAERSMAEAASGFLFWAVVFSVCWMMRNAVHRGSNGPQRARHMGNAVAIAGMLLFLLRLSADGLLPALLAFLFAIQAAVFVIADKRMHVWLILAAAFAGLLFAAAESRSPLFLVCAAWFTFAALGLLALDWRSERERLTVLKPLDRPAAPAGGFLYGAAALMLAVPLYLFAPKPAGLLLGGMQAKTAHDYNDRPASDRMPRNLPPRGAPEPSIERETSSPPSSIIDAPTAHPGQGRYGDSFSVSDIERAPNAANVIVLYVKSSDTIYLRGKIYDRFEQDRWTRDEHRVERHELTRGRYERSAAASGANSVQQMIEVAIELDNTLLHAPGLQRLRFPGPVVRSFDDGVFEVPQPLQRDTTYSVESQMDLDGGRYVLRQDDPGDSERYLDVSPDVSDRLRGLARNVTAGTLDARGKALALERHLRTHYSYSYETVAQQGNTPLDWFLFEGKRGHCEFFASALAVMLRTVGVPARVATGFSLGERNPVTGYYEVRALDGHAWVEARIPGKGWLMLEPTPFYPLPEPKADEQVAQQLDRYLDRLAETSKVLDPESFKTSMTVLARESWRHARVALKQVSDLPRQLGWLLPALILAAIVALFVGYLMLLWATDAMDNISVRQTLKRAEKGDLRTATLLLADALQDAAAPRGFGREPGWTFREYVKRLSQTDNAVPAAFADLFDFMRYAHNTELKDDGALNGIGEVIEKALQKNKWPRVTRTVRYWSSFARRGEE